MSAYPSFPQLSRAFSLNQTEQVEDPTLRDNMENGMETTRAKWTRVRNTLTVTLKLLTADDKEELRSFLQDTVNYGALPFLLLDPRNLENPITRTVRVASMPKYSDAGWIAEDTLGSAAQYRWDCTFQVREV